MNMFKKLAAMLGLSEAPKQYVDNPKAARRALRSLKQAQRGVRRDAMGIPAAKRHRFRYYLYNPAWFGIQQNQMAKGIVRPAS